MNRITRKSKGIGQHDINTVINMWRCMVGRYSITLEDWLDGIDRAFPAFNIKPNKVALIDYINARVPHQKDIN